MSEVGAILEHVFEGEGEAAAEVLLSRARSNRVAAYALDVELLELAQDWADAHPGLAPGGPVLPILERPVRLGGEGTPTVAEYAPAELAVELDTSTAGGQQLIADALDLRHRLPRLWARVQAGEVKPWLARKAAQATHRHPLALARRIDAAIAGYADRLSLTQLENLLEATWKRLDPAGAALDEQTARTGLGVWVGRDHQHGLTNLVARLESADAIRLDAAVARGADALQALGDTRGLGPRRAAAMGVLADPQDTLDLWAAHTDLAAGDGTGARVPAFDLDTAPMPGESPRCQPRDPDDGEPPVVIQPSMWRRLREIDPPPAPRPRRDLGPTVMLYVHLTDQTLATGQGVARVERVGPLTAATVRDWLAGSGARVTVRPVIDLNQQVPVDAYEIPPRLAEAVRLRSPLDAFPYSTSTSRRMDLDHTEPYLSPDNGGPPGQTRTENLAPLTRRHHRIKTHSRGWAVRQVYDGVLVWRTPHGRYYLVDHTGTQRALVA